ncbi:hypothetical protein [Kushneria indalinina]|uniref:hypothetical protein n=1 Tax=Kushneria indalinina TaxID=184067 RepID=UPI0011C0773A|nr:hypothetical protein [Kushneria indalinina]
MASKRMGMSPADHDKYLQSADVMIETREKMIESIRMGNATNVASLYQRRLFYLSVRTVTDPGSACRGAFYDQREVRRNELSRNSCRHQVSGRA